MALPVLSTYLGHKTIYATERYVRLTMELYPYIGEKCSANLVPRCYAALSFRLQPVKETEKAFVSQAFYVMLILLYSTGIRVSELTGIRVKDLSLHEPHTLLVHGKGKKSRYVPLMKDSIPIFLSAAPFLQESQGFSGIHLGIPAFHTSGNG